MNTVHVPSGEDATFERVETGREGDRVYILQVGEGAGGRHFFWMQDRDASGDEDICVKVNLYLSDAEEAKKAAGFEGEEGSAAAAGTGGGDANEEGGMDNDQLLRIMQGALGGEQGRAVTGGALFIDVILLPLDLCANVVFLTQQSLAVVPFPPPNLAKSMRWETFLRILECLSLGARFLQANTPHNQRRAV